MLALGALLAVACGGPSAPSGPALTIACPASLTVPSPTGSAVTVDYGAPTVTGGTTPVTTSCTLPSGSSFPVGSTPVTCTASDAHQRVAACSFTVSVSASSRLSATRFLAFGDSITEGVLEHPCRFAKPATLAEFFDDLRSLSAAVDNPGSYPSVLQSLLISRYTAQSPFVTNEGLGGEFVTEARSRLSGVLAIHAPQVLLLQEGVNDVNAFAPTKGQSAIAGIVADLRTLVRDAQSRGVQVLVGTLLPQRPGACRAFAPEFIVPANNQIRTMAVAEGAVVVDLYQAFDGQLATLLGADGLHPNAAGYEKMAQTFFDTIRQTLETTSAMAPFQ